jgi:hypothetical protein
LRMVFLCFLLTGCAGREVLDEIPKDFILSWGETETVSEEEEEESSSEEEEPAECFLMEEASSFAYKSLNEAERAWYRDMERILGGFQEEGVLSRTGLEGGLDDTCIDKVFQCVLSDHPELFYVEGYSYVKYAIGNKITALHFSGTYSMDLETAVVRREEIRAAVEELAAGISEDASDYEKVKYVYETLIRNTDYDLEAPDNQNIYSVFVRHFSVCQGYAKATQYLLNFLGVECTLVLGTVESGEGHAWNLVKVDGDYYYVDTTWGDVSYRTDGSGENGEISMPEINYDYLNVTTEELLRTHSIGGEVPMPLCTAKTANYYVQEGALFTAYDREQMAALFQKAAGSGQNDITVKCADAACYEEILRILIEDQEIFQFLAEGESRIAYAQNEKQLSLTFWVTNE